MNLKILFLLLMYYGILTLAFGLGGSMFTDVGFESNIEFNQTGELTDAEIETGGFFDVGVDFGRFFVLIAFGVGLPDDTPTWFAVLFILWQTLFTIFTVGFIVSSIWDG